MNASKMAPCVASSRRYCLNAGSALSGSLPLLRSRLLAVLRNTRLASRPVIAFPARYRFQAAPMLLRLDVFVGHGCGVEHGKLSLYPRLVCGYCDSMTHARTTHQDGRSA